MHLMYKTTFRYFFSFLKKGKQKAQKKSIEERGKNVTQFLITGTPILKDTYVTMLQPRCDLRAPDFSYMIIAELR